VTALFLIFALTATTVVYAKETPKEPVATTTSDPEATTISSVIAKYNFFNSSTFTQAYKQMFGELPVEQFKISH